MKKIIILLTASLFIFIGALCSRVNSEISSVKIESGQASWYGETQQGKVTQSGEIFDLNSLVGSHPTLPFGEYAKVTSRKTGKSVVVKINDRISFTTGRVIDISKRAAEEIGLTEEGVGSVTVEALGKNYQANNQNTSQDNLNKNLVYEIQYGSFSDLTNAQNFQKILISKQIKTSIVPIDTNNVTYYRVTGIEKYSSQEQAKAKVASLSFEEASLAVIRSLETNNNISNNTNTSNTSSQETLTGYNAGIQNNLSGFSASHINIPVGNYIRVVNSADTKRFVVLKILETMPKGTGMIVGISGEAGKELNIKQGEIKTVFIEDLGKDLAKISTLGETKGLQDSNSGDYIIQYGSFNTLSNAQKLQQALADRGIQSSIDPVETNGKIFYRINSARKYDTEEKASCQIVLNSPEYGVVKKISTNNIISNNTSNTSQVSKPSETKINNSATNNASTKTGSSIKYEYGIQFGAFQSFENAKKLASELERINKITTIIYQFPNDSDNLYRVLSDSPFKNEQEAKDFIIKNNLTGKAKVLAFLAE